MKLTKIMLSLLGGALLLTGCQGGGESSSSTSTVDNLIHVNFDTVIPLKTNKIREQVYDAPHKVKKPTVVIVDENPESLDVYGWYKDRSYENEWNFKTDLAEQSMTLYAKFVSKFTVNYYQGVSEDSMALIGTETVFKGDALPYREDLPDCYENPGDYYVTDITKNEDGTYRGVKGKEVDYESATVESQVNVLLLKSENFYLSPGALSRRFSNVASCAGSNGSTPGRIDVFNEGTPDAYAKVDFGIVSDKDSVVDPYILMDNPAIDVTKSKYIEIKMKNLGAGDTLSFYWVGKWACNNQFINGKEYHSFGEDRRWSFKKGEGANTDGVSYTDYNGKTYRNKMKETDGWQTYLLPISNRTYNGVSTWGCAGKITALRIQSTFTKTPGMSEEAKKNVLLIKYIKGVADPTGKKYDFIDTDEIKGLCKDDDPAAIEEAKKAQSQINGFIFPKNADAVNQEGTNATVYTKTDSVYAYGEYVNGSTTLSLTGNEHIDLDTHTTIRFRYRNFSYVDKLTFTLLVNYVENGVRKEKKVVTTYSMPARMTSTEEAKINMFGTNNYRGYLKQLDVSFTPVGVDNLIKFEFIEFADYEPKNLNGYNWNDLHCGNFIYESGLIATYDSVHKGTKVVASQSDKSASLETPYFDISAFDGFNFSYVNDQGGITKILVNLTIDGTVRTYPIDLETSQTSKTAKVELAHFGILSGVSVKFIGTGTVYLRSMQWTFPHGNSLDFSNGEYAANNAKFKNDDWKNYVYDATELGLLTTQRSSFIYGRLGVRGYTVDGWKATNFSLKGKTKIMAMYQNRSSNTYAYLSFGAILKSEYLENQAYLTAERLAHNPLTINGETHTPSENQTVRNIKTNMEAGEWAVMSLDIPSFYTREEYEVYLTSFFFSTHSDMTGSFYIRGITVK